MATEQRPPCDLRGVGASEVVIARVVATLKAAKLHKRAKAFKAAALAAAGPNAVFQLARREVEIQVWQ